MTDKVQKIREEVVRMHNLLPIMGGDNIYVNYADSICTTLEMYIDSLQEEPKQEVESNPDFKKPSLVIRKGEKYFCIKDYHDKNCTFTMGKIYQSDKDGFLIDDEDKNTFERKIWEEDACEYFIPSLQKEPKFKVGDTVRYKYNHIHTKPRIIAEICGFSHYVDTDGCRMDMAYTDANFELVEEPVSEEWIEELRTKLDSMSKEDFKKVFDKYAVDFNEEPVSDKLEKVVEEIVDPTVLNAYGVKGIANRLRRTMIEPVGEELEEAANEIVNKAIPPLAVKYKDGTYVGKIRDCFDRKEFIDLVKAGAQWQKQKDNNNANHALVEQIKTQQMCYEKGMADMKQQMMAKAIEGDITFDYYGDDDKTYGCIAHNSFCLEDFGLKDRDKVKVIVIKED